MQCQFINLLIIGVSHQQPCTVFEHLFNPLARFLYLNREGEFLKFAQPNDRVMADVPVTLFRHKP